MENKLVSYVFGGEMDPPVFEADKSSCLLIKPHMLSNSKKTKTVNVNITIILVGKEI